MTDITSTLPYLNLQTTPHEWIHYAVEERADDLDIELEDGYRQKCEAAMHFAIGDAWVRTASDWSIKPYAHKYKLLNFSDLKLLEISRSTVIHLLPLSLGQWGPNWKLIRDRGYDGVYVHHDDLYYNKPQPSVPDGYTRWRDFAHRFDIDTVVVWRGAKLEEITNDWPPLNEDCLQREREFQERRKKYDAERAVKLAAMTEEEQRVFIAKEKKSNRRSFDASEGRTKMDVEYYREYFKGYDEHYPVKPPGSPPWPVVAPKIKSEQS